jgi:hypothetical protein
MNKLRTRHMALVLGVAAIAAAGCGSSSSSKTTPASPATSGLTPSTPSTGTSTTAVPKSGFYAQLNMLCKQGNALSKNVTTAPEAAAVAEKLLPKLEALTPPAGQKATYEAYLSNLKQEIAAAKANDIATLKKLTAKEKSLGKQLGAPECAA